MTGPEPAPTFNSKRDRVTYLIGEYKLIIASAILAGGILVAWSDGSIEVPGWVGGVAAAYLLFGPISYIGGRKIIKWVRRRHWIDVFHINAATDEREKWLVPPSVWEEKTVDGPPPRRVNDQQDFEVREFEWMGDVEQLHVEGSRFEETMDSKMVTSRSYAQDVHDFLEDSHATLKDIRDRWSRMAIDVKGAVVNQISEAHERGINPDNDAAREIWEEAESDIDEDIDTEIPGITHDHVERDMQQWRDAPADRDGDATPGGDGQ